MVIDENILFYAFRYALGRMTTAPSMVVRNLLNNWQHLSDDTKNQIKEEILQYREQNKLCGMKIDDDEWQKVLDKC